eukprot:5175848-Prymnesium_polylepis.3
MYHIRESLCLPRNPDLLTKSPRQIREDREQVDRDPACVCWRHRMSVACNALLSPLKNRRGANCAERRGTAAPRGRQTRALSPVPSHPHGARGRDSELWCRCRKDWCD